MDVGVWLRSLGLGQYETNFRDNKIDADLLARLTDHGLKDIGVSALGDRLRLLDAIAVLASARPLADAAVSSAKSAALKAEQSAERRPITVMFCDLVGSTSLSSRLDAEDWRNLVNTYLDEASAAVTGLGGQVLKKLGDGLMALFGYPIAQENDAERAVRAALAIQRALGEMNARNAAKGAPALAARIGLESGPVVVEATGEVFGDAPNTAARVQAFADPGSVFITLNVQRQAAGLFVAEDKGVHQLKGVAEPVNLFRIVRASGAGRRSGARAPTPFVGREEELGLLTRRWERTLAGDGQLVLIVGEPGLGKSRLIEEFRARIAEAPHTWVEWSASQLLQNTPLHPIAEWGRQRFGPADAHAEQRLADLEGTLRLIGLDPAEYAPLVAPLVDIPLPPGRAEQLPPEELRRRQLAAIISWVLAGARTQAIVLAFEDLQWADPTSIDLMRALAERGAQARLLLLTTSRPEFRPPWSLRSHHGVISLAPLDRAQALQMVGKLASRHALSKEVIDGVGDRTGGVPLFVEEVTRLLLERGDPGSAQAIPLTLQQSLAARLDRLGEARETAQIGAVLGREFAYHSLRDLAEMDEPVLQVALERLAEADILFVEGAGTQAVYRFKHALVQEAAYQTLLRSRRQQLHSKIAHALETRFPETAGSRPELLAMHYAEAGQPERSISYRLKAAQLSASRFANAEAITHATRGLTELRSLPQSEHRHQLELQFLTALGPAFVATRGYAADETVEAYERARELVNESGGEKNWDVVLTGLFVAYYNRAAYRAGLDVGQEFLKQAESAVHRCVGHRMLAVSYNIMGRFDESVVEGEAAFSHYDPAAHSDLAWQYTHDIGVAAATHWAIGAWHRGQLALADRMQKEALGIAERLGHPNTLGYALYYDGILASLWRRDGESLRHFTSRFREHAIRQESPQWIAWVAPPEGLALAQQGQVEGGIEMIENGIANCDRIKNRAMRPVFLMCLADALRLAGRYERAEQTSATALAISTETGERWVDAEIHRLSGKVALATGGSQNVEKAKHHLNRSLSVAELQGSVMFRLRTLLDLHEVTNGEEARTTAQMISSCLATVPDTEDAPELSQAKAILGAQPDLRRCAIP